MDLLRKHSHLATFLEQTESIGTFEYNYVDSTMTWSDGMYRIFECDFNTYSPVIEQHSIFFNPDDIELLATSLNRLEGFQTPVDLAVNVTTFRGTKKNIHFKMQGEFIDGKIRRRFGTARDVSQEQKELEDNAFFRERVNLALHASNTGTWDYDVKNDRLFWHNSMFMIFDVVSAYDIRGFSSWVDMIHPEDRNEFIDAFNRGSKGLLENHTLMLTSRIMTALGRISFIKLNARFYIDETGQNFRIVGTCVDTTDSEVIQREIVNQATHARTRFLANMSHEIRTPMNTIMGALQILQSYELDTDSADLVDMAMQSSNDLLSLINDILDLSKIDAHEMALESIATDIVELGKKAIEKFQVQLQKPIEMRMEVAKNINTKRMTDPVRINQVLNNFLGNAIKFTQSGAIDLIITGDEENISLTVKDTGIGIPQDKLKAIFEPFKQADESTTRVYGGTGLGLAICKSISEAMGGEISVSSLVDYGSEFTLSVPMPVSSLSHITDMKQIAKQSTIDIPYQTVLVICAESDLSLNISAILTANQINVHMIAPSDTEEFIAKNEIDLAICVFKPNDDISKMAPKTLRKNLPELPIIGYRFANIEHKEYVDNMHLFDDLISEPISESGLLQKLTRLLENSPNYALK